MPLIDEWLPEFDVGERHDIAVPLAPERALELALSTPVASDLTVRALLTARGMAARTETIERFVPLGTAEAWRAAQVAGTIKAAADFRAERIPGGSRLTTETRVKAIDEHARRAFRLYWLAIGPFSALIRGTATVTVDATLGGSDGD